MVEQVNEDENSREGEWSGACIPCEQGVHGLRKNGVCLCCSEILEPR